MAVEVKATKKAGRPKKRGPKSVWGNFILRRLRQCDRPLSYSELVRDAMVLNNLPAEKEKNAKASVLNAAFRLRNTLKKVDTIGLPGKKEKFLVLKSWMNLRANSRRRMTHVQWLRRQQADGRSRPQAASSVCLLLRPSPK